MVAERKMTSLWQRLFAPPKQKHRPPAKAGAAFHAFAGTTDISR
jgi:hypothetical protein